MKMQRRYGSTQVCEYRLTQREVDKLVIANAEHRLVPSYDFDTENPVLLRVDGDYVVRFVQRPVNYDGEPRTCEFKAFETVP